MFDLVAKHKRIAQLILFLIMVPFAFLGVDYYFRRDAQTPSVATVGGDKVTRAEFDELVRQQQDRMRQTMGRAFDPAIFDNPEVRYSLVEQLVSQRLLQQQAKEQRFWVTDAELARAIGEIEAFRVDGKFSPERYRQLLAAQNMTPAMFEQRLREDLVLAPLSEPLAAGNIVAKSSAERFVAPGNGRFEALGKLTIRDVTREIRLPFGFKPAADGARAELAGGIAIRRLDYGVGQGEWQDTQWIGDEVRIRFTLHLQRK